MRDLQFYVRPMGDITIKNPGVIPFMYHSKFLCLDRLNQDLWLQVSHATGPTRRSSFTSSEFHTIYQTRYNNDPNIPYQQAILYAEGTQQSDGEGPPLFAKLTLNLNRLGVCPDMMLSPVPFGDNGKLTLPKGTLGIREGLHYLFDQFACDEPIAAPIITGGMQPHLPEEGYVTDVVVALEDLQILRREEKGRIVRLLITKDRFEELFGPIKG